MAARAWQWGVAFGLGVVLAATVALGALAMERRGDDPNWLMERKSDAFTEALDRAYWTRAWATSVAYANSPAGAGTFRRAAPQFERAVELLAETEATGAGVLPQDSLVALRKVLVGALRTADRSRALKGAPEDWNRQDAGQLMDEGLVDLVRQARQTLGVEALDEATVTMTLSPPSEPGKWGMPIGAPPE